MTDDEFGGRRGIKPVFVVAAVVAAAVVGGWLYWRSHAVLPAIPEAVEPPPVAPPVEAPIAHPIPAAASEPPGTPLPELNESDKAVGDALAAAAGNVPLAQYVVPESLIRHIVVTVDNLPRQKVAVDKRPVSATPGSFTADGDELHATLDTRNFQRYAPLVDLVRKAEVQRLVVVYLRFYPLFQKAYQDLGYPTGYFNDRLVQVIDLLLATPQVPAPIDLVRPNVMYVFADPQLEALPAGQKVLIRMGPDNAAVIKAKLMELRAAITAAPPKH